MMPENIIKILGIPFTTLNQKEILGKIEQALDTGNKLFLATPNPEMLLIAQKNPQFKKVLQQTDLNLPDGNGLIWAKKYLDKTVDRSNKILLVLSGIISLMGFIGHRKNNHSRFNKTIHGSDLTMEIFRHPKISRQALFLLGNKHGLKPKTAELTAKKLKQQFPQLQLVGFADSDSRDQSLVKKINDSQARILLVGFGAPQQELWLYQNLPLLKNIQIAIGIGGTFDFILGIIPRAPKLLRNLGLEWLFRLYKQPRRFKRIFNATIVFPYQVIKSRLANPDKYKT